MNMGEFEPLFITLEEDIKELEINEKDFERENTKGYYGCFSFHTEASAIVFREYLSNCMPNISYEDNIINSPVYIIYYV